MRVRVPLVFRCADKYTTALLCPTLARGGHTDGCLTVHLAAPLSGVKLGAALRACVVCSVHSVTVRACNSLGQRTGLAVHT